MTKRFSTFLLFLGLGICINTHAQSQSFLILGDIHYDLLENHDMEWLQKKPDDLRQVTTEYTQFPKKIGQHLVNNSEIESKPINPK